MVLNFVTRADPLTVEDLTSRSTLISVHTWLELQGELSRPSGLDGGAEAFGAAAATDAIDTAERRQ